jgi:hypothetical protein
VSHQLTCTVHEVATDGLPTDSRFDHDLHGRVAFVFNSHLISGWPTNYGAWKSDGVGDDGVPKAGVTHWVEFPVPIAQLPNEQATTLYRTEVAEPVIIGQEVGKGGGVSAERPGGDDA